MPDIVKHTNQLSLLAGFADEDDRTINLDDPVENLSASAINAVGALAVGVLIGDKYAAQFTRFKSAKYVDKIKVELDITGA